MDIYRIDRRSKARPEKIAVEHDEDGRLEK